MRAKKFEAKRREIPIGKGRELNEVMRDHLLIFEKVKNKVAFVNLGFVDPEKKINLPFKLEEGKESPFALSRTFRIPRSLLRLGKTPRASSSWVEYPSTSKVWDL